MADVSRSKRQSGALWCIQCGLWSIVALCAGITLYWLLWAGSELWRSDRTWRDFPRHLGDGCDTTQIVDVCLLRQLVYLWLPTAAAALAATILLAMGAHLRPSRPPALARQLPGRRFWAGWCGGLSVTDGIVVLTWAAINGVWLGWMMWRYELLAPVFKKSPVWRVQGTLIGVALGQVLVPNLVLLFYPVTRGSVLLQVSGISYPNAIRYHRWLGHATLVFATAHSLGFWGIWFVDNPHTFLQKAMEQGKTINNLMGGLSFVFALALWLTSLERARRWSYDLFYKMHHIGFWGFMLLGCMHYADLFWGFLPGMMLYAVDAVYRLTQLRGEPVQVMEAYSSADARVACLTLVSPSWGVATTGYVWINAPDISATEWHPFEYVSADTPRKGQPPSLVIYTKAYSRWTKKFVALVKEQGTSICLRSEGPYPELPPQAPPGRERGLVLVTGGIGITAALSVLKEMGHAAPDTQAKLPPRAHPTRGLPVLLVWASRHASEFTLLMPKVLDMVEELGVSLQVHLYFTGDPKELASLAGSPSPLNPGASQLNAQPYLGNSNNHNSLCFILQCAAIGSGERETTDQGMASGELPITNSAAPQIGLTPSTASSSPFLDPENAIPVDVQPSHKPKTHPSRTPMCPVLALQSPAHEAAHKVQLHAWVFIGALVALIGVRYAGIVRAKEQWPTAWLGAAYVGGISLGMLLPGLWVLGAWRLVAACSQGRPGQAGGADRKGAVTDEPAGSEAGVDGRLREPLLVAHADQPEVQDGGNAPANGGVARIGALSGVAAAPRASSMTSSHGPRFARICLVPQAAPRGETTVGAIAGMTAPGLFQGLTATLAGADGRVHGHSAAGGYIIQQGRPPVDRIVKCWLKGLEQLPQGVDADGRDVAQMVRVCAMGPEAMVLAAQLLCDDLNKCDSVTSHGNDSRLNVCFERKTFEL